MLSRHLTRSEAEFSLTGPDVEPLADPAWTFAATSERVAYFQELARNLFEERRSAHLKGEDWTGQPMPRRLRPRRDGATGRVLAPHHSDSRFLTKLRYRGETSRAVVWWTRDWAVVVFGHASGQATGIVRDVVGLSLKRQERAVARARKWWAGRVQRGQELGPLGRVEWMGGTPAAVGQQITPTFRLGQTPARVATPSFAADLAAWTVQQRLNSVYQAAAVGNTTEAQVRATIAALGALPLEVLRDVAGRFGISPAPADRAGVLRLLERQLLGRLAEARRLRRRTVGPQPPTPPVPPTPPRPGGAVYQPILRPTPGLGREPILPGVFADAVIPPEIAAALPPEIAVFAPATLADLAKIPGGVAWWVAHGLVLWNLWRAAG